MKRAVDIPLLEQTPRPVWARVVTHRYFWVASFVMLYTQLLGAVSYVGSPQIIRTEIPLVLYLYALFYHLLRPSRIRSWLAALPIVVLYGITDAYYIAYGTVAQMVEFLMLGQLIEAVGVGGKIAMAVCVGLPALVFVLSLRPKRRSVIWCTPLAVIVTMMLWFPATLIAGVDTLAHSMTSWSTARNVSKNGRITMGVYYEAQRRLNLRQLANYRDANRLSTFINDAAIQNPSGRNVHLFVLESWINPTGFESITYSSEPTATAFLPFQSYVGETRSPMFSGGTSQSEFEILCGVPALRRVGAAEFNPMTGSSTYCLPTILRQMGYRTIATNGYQPNFYNTRKAYESLGFGEQYFPRKYTPADETYVEVAEETRYAFDGDLFEQNLAFLKPILATTHPIETTQSTYIAASSGSTGETGPILNYMLGIYGHTPFVRDLALRPDRFEVSPPADHIKRLAHQYHYRTKAIAEQIHRLLEVDPYSLIIFVGDHLPPLPGGRLEYEQLRYRPDMEDAHMRPPILVIRDGQAVRYPTMSHPDVFRLVLDYVTDGAFCEDRQCRHLGTNVSTETLAADYMTIMGLATR